MGVVGPVGVWDKELHSRYAALLAARPHSRANDALERALLGEIVLQNAPLIRHFIARLRGPHIDRLGHEEVEATVRIAFVRAVQTYDSTKGGIAGWFAWKLRPELEAAERLDAIVKGKARTRAPDVTYLGEEDGELIDTEDWKVRLQLRRQVRPKIFISEHDGDRIRKETRICRATVQRYAAGLGVHPGTERAIVAAMEKLNIARVERKQWPAGVRTIVAVSPGGEAPEIEAAPASHA